MTYLSVSQIIYGDGKKHVQKGVVSKQHKDDKI